MPVQKCTDPALACGNCNGFGIFNQIGVAPLTDRTPIVEVKCRACNGTGRRDGVDPPSEAEVGILTTERLIENLNGRIRREIGRRIKIGEDLDAVRSAAKQIWDDLMIAHEAHGGGDNWKDVSDESVERLGSVLFRSGRKDPAQ